MSKNQRQTLAKQCVKCAICLPHCPTYQLSLDENESPRGRIALMQGLAEDALAPSLKLAQHLDNCLQCGSCTAVCPANVQYDQLLAATHLDVTHSITPRVKRIGRLVQNIVKSPTRVWFSASLLYLIQKTKLLYLLGLRKLHKKIPKLYLRNPQASTNPVQSNKRVTLLSGCIGKVVDAKTINDAIFVLQRLGFHVDLPKPSCCGSLAYHHGLFKEADALLAEQEHLNGNPETQAIISLASGCSAHLYDRKKQSKHPWLNKVQDIHDFLVGLDLQQHKLLPVNESFKLHIPCTAKNQLKQEQTLLQVYQQIPGLKLEVAATPSRCCGAAGLYMLEHPSTAEALGHQLLQSTKGSIASPNIGCRLHLQSLQPERCLLHPVSILAKSLGLPK